MKLLALHIVRIPGLRTGLDLRTEHLAGRVVVLHGPNAIGKSSILRGLKALLWPREFPASGAIEIEGRFEIRGTEWTARREGAQTRWMRDGVEVEPPLPAWRHADLMLVGLETLGPGGERDVVEHVQRELGGGCDIGAVEALLRPGSRVGQTQARALEDAEEALRAARLAQDAIVRQGDTLDEARRARDGARDAARQVVWFDRALGLARATRELELARASLAVFPVGLDRWRGSEPEELDRLRTRFDEVRKGQEAAHRKVAEFDAAIARNGLGEPIANGVLGGLEERVGVLRDAQEKANAARSAETTARMRLIAVEASFGAGVDLDRFASLDAGIDAEVEEFARSENAHARHVAELEARLAAIGDVASAPPPAARAIAALEDWLAAPQPAATDSRARKFLLALALACVAVAVGLAFVHWAFLGLLALAVIAWIGSRSKQPVGGLTRDEHVATYARTNESAPDAWTADSVRARLAALRERDARAVEARTREDQRTELSARLTKLAEAGRGIEQRRTELAARLGATASAPGASLVAFAEACTALRSARRAAEESTAEFQAREALRVEALAQLNADFEAQGAVAARDLVGANVRIRDLRERSGDLASKRVERSAEHSREIAAREEAKRIERDIAELFARGGLAPGDDAGLHDRLERLEPWKSAVRERDQLTRDVERLRADLSAMPKPNDELDPARLSLAQLEDGRERAREIAEKADELAERVTTIETELRSAREARTLESTQATRDEARGKLEAVFAEARRRALACALLADVRAAHETTSRPQIVEEAERLFARFTLGRFALRTATVDGRSKLMALDSFDASHPFELGELSDGTRAQLLLAARLAYMHTIESGDPLPLILDDALATSDPARKQQIGAALLAVAREEGRQVILLTPDAADAILLRPPGASDGDVVSTDLAIVRALQLPVLDRSRMTPPDSPRVPAPVGSDAAAYADALAAAGLPVRPFDPRREADEVHLWWILQQDLGALHRALDLRFDAGGSFRNAARAGVAGVGIRELQAAEPWIALAAGVIEAWRIGRGRTIDREVLTQAGVTDTFIDKMTSLAADLGGDAKAWYAAVFASTDERAKRYQRKILEQNREFLVREGYLDERDVLDRERVWLRVLASLPPNHGLEADALRRRFELLWQSCTPRDDSATTVPGASDAT